MQERLGTTFLTAKSAKDRYDQFLRALRAFRGLGFNAAAQSNDGSTGYRKVLWDWSYSDSSHLER